ncbi:EthD family reductase [Arthrobacter sp. 35W]|uniref:EthD family reductase n=1 Tax=Arthrobacter sp. 35W TaxID=1132441 RepID=UPI00040E8DDB|nr:EthD family reductase [Arthrobacter sp. 35W]
MAKIAIILFRNEQTLAEQHRWWLEDHAPLAKKMPGLLSYTINLADLDEYGNDPQIAGTDYLEFADWDAAQAAYESAEWQAAREHTAASGAKTIRTWIRDTQNIEI